MKRDIHPVYKESKFTCSCGNVISVPSTLCQDIHIEICSKCHPFYTGQQKLMDTGGRIDQFKKRFGRLKTRPQVGQDSAQKGDKSKKKGE